jgi:hypothetical protein
MKNQILIIGGFVGAIIASAALALPPLPDWQQLESDHKQDHGVGIAQQSMITALPAGTPIETARAALIADGASCKHSRNHQAVEKCLIHQYNLGDGAADDIRWTITISAPNGRVEMLKLNRYVDRHGTA